MSICKQPLKVVILYEDKEAADRIESFRNSWHGKQILDGEVEEAAWNFDVLEYPGMRRLALGDAMLAQVILFGAREGAELPPGVLAWLNGWLRSQHPRRVVLVAILGRMPFHYADVTPVKDALRRASAIAPATFVCPEVQPEDSSVADRAETEFCLV